MPDAREVRFVYFAWVRERIGLSEETRALPEHVQTVQDLLSWLPSLGEEYEAAMAHASSLRVALDQEIVQANDEIGAPREIAIFPPMTGG